MATSKIASSILLMAFAPAALHAQSLSQVVNQALQTYPAVLSASARSAAARTDITRARSAHYPQIGLNASVNAFSSGALPVGTERTSLSPTARVNLWSGGRIEAEAQRAEALTLASEFEQANTLDEVALLATEAYLNWAKTADLYSLAVRNVNAHRVTLNDIQKISQADTGRRVDYEQALVRMENATLALQQSKSDFTQAIQRLRRFWKGDMDARPMNLDAEVSAAGVLGRIPPSLAQAMELVSEDLPTIAQARAQVQAAQASVRQAKGQFWPTVDLAVSRQLNTTTGRQDVLTQLQVNAPLYNGGGTSALVENAVNQVKSAEFALDEARLLARENAALAWQEWASARARSDTGSAQTLVGDKLVDAYRQQFRVARRSLLDLLNIQADTFNYRSAATAAFHDERIARARLLAATGELAKRFSAEPGLVPPPAR
ncbi:MAG: TolC family protein [Limnohabitans sp.]|nr:TolC family protein [Limnohabitans sp.]MDP4732718.1 TolC family protein [Limnohabitans sp.]MDP4771080.1 TolC family protein [Limnohabitans sp.]